VIRRLFAFLVCVRLVGCVWPGAAVADPAPGRRIALVIGNAAYRNVPRLANPDNDARSIAAALASLGFTLIGGGAQLDLDKPGLEGAIRAFGDALKEGDVGLFYYAGHGLQVHGENYLVPVDANPTREADIDFELVDANLVLRQMEDSKTKLNIMILDACRNNPFGGRGLGRAIATGLAQMQAPEGTIISYATQPGNVAEDGTGEHSPFATAITATLATPGLPVLETFNRIGVTVKHETGGRQQPWVSNSPIEGDFYFATGASGAASMTPAPPPLAPAAPSAPPSTARAPGPLALTQPLAPPQQPEQASPAQYMVGRWRIPDGRACTRLFGTVSVSDDKIIFEWHLPGGRLNVAVERIDRIEGNTIITTVLSDVGTPNSEAGQLVRYTIAPDHWISENLLTHERTMHLRC